MLINQLFCDSLVEHTPYYTLIHTSQAHHNSQGLTLALHHSIRNHNKMLSTDHKLVNIGTHSLALYTYGPEPKSSTDPVVLFVQGVGCSSLGWAGVLDLLPPSTRCYVYDRSGFTNSELSPLPPTAENVAAELSLLIEKAPIMKPIILVGHSWAGVLISEFIDNPDNAQRVAGVVLVDANHETQPLVIDVNDPIFSRVFQGVDLYEAKGLNKDNKLTIADWKALRADGSTEKHYAASEREEAEYANSFPTLRAKKQSERQPLLQDKPVYVIGGLRSRDWTGMLQAGIARGNGTPEQRSHVEEMIRTADEKSKGLMHELLKLSTTNKLVFARESGHFVQYTQPDVVTDGVKWVLSNIEAIHSV